MEIIMGEEKSIRRIIMEALLGLAVLVWSFLVLNKGFYMDESGMLTIYRGIYLGNRMMVDAWGAHQMGWFLVYPFMALYDVIEPLCTAYGIGFVLYMRICYQIFRLLVAIYLYITIRRTEYRNSAFIVALTYYAYFLSFKNFSYKSMCEMSIMLFLCWAYRYFQTKNAFYYILMAIATSASILAYPSMILFPVIFVIAQFVMMYKGYELLKPTVLYCITCFVLGIAVVLYIQFTAGIQNVLPQLQYTEDAAYKYPIYTRLGIMLLSYVAFAVIAYAPILVMKIIGHFRYISQQTVHLVLAIYWLLFMGAVIGLRPFSTSTTRYIYGCLVVMFWFPYLARNKKDHNRTEIGQYRTSDYDTRNFINFIIFISATCQLIWSVTTNQEVTVPGYMGFYLVLGVLILSEAQDSGLRILRASVVAFTLFFMGFWVAESDGGYNDILEHRTVVENGGYMGIALDDFDYAMNRSCHNLIEEYVSDEDKLYIVNAFGTTGYLDTKAIQAAGSPFSRVGVGKQYRVLEFWQVNPDRQPDYILVDTANKYYEEYTQGETYKYISENYPVTVATDGNVILLSK
jgi:hypothetical protein